MQGDGGKYGWVSTEYGRTIVGEPLFVIRGNDDTAVETIEEHIRLARDRGASDEYISATRVRVDQFKDWKSNHPDLAKTPDN